MSTAKHSSSSDEGLTTGASCTYSIAVRTSAIPSAETSAFVFVQVMLLRPGDPTILLNGPDLFLLVCDQPTLGKLKSCEVTHIYKECRHFFNLYLFSHSSSSDEGLTTGASCTYSIAVRTSAIPSAETSAFVFVQATGQHRSS
ncbi:hypothetical protein OSTOST_04656 [Ostertagia ostertagi]